MAGADLVSIFWDYENCRPPSGIAGNVLVDKIRTIAHQYGRVTAFKAYFDLAEAVSSKSPNIRSELQASGVSLNDCPHDGRKDVADKMIIVDMLAFAIDHPAPATVILISGDRDFAYALSVLRLRTYRVVVITPRASSASIKYSASEILDWDRDIVPECSTVPPTTWRRHSDSQSSTGSDDSLAAKGRGFPLSPMDKIWQEYRSIATSSAIEGFGSQMRADSSQESFDSISTEPTSQSSSSSDSSGFFTKLRALSPPPKSSLKAPVLRRDAVPFRPAPSVPPSSSYHQERRDGTLGHATTLAPETAYVRAISSPVNIKSPSWTPISFVREGGAAEKTPGSSYAAVAGAGKPPGQDTETPKVSKTASWIPASSGKVPPQFKQLVEVLEKARQEGQPKQVWSIVAAGIQNRKEVYEKAGASSFREFAELAEKAGVVKLGGDPGDCPWIRLRPEWHNKVRVRN